jgi:menaquinone-dependent protoporphyrinogen oxidase
MPERVLVTYAWRKESTAEVAEAIGASLRTRGFDVKVESVEADAAPDCCAAMVIGSPVNGGQWLPEAVAYVRQHQAALNRVPTAVFTVHIMNAGTDERSRRKRLAYVGAVRSLIHPSDEAFFLGIGPDPSKDSWLARWLFRRFGGAGEGDCRDWKQVRGRAGRVLESVLARPVAGGGVESLV